MPSRLSTKTIVTPPNEERQLPQSAGNAVKMQVQVVKNRVIGEIGDFRTAPVGRPGFAQSIFGLAGVQLAALKDGFILLFVYFSTKINLYLEPFGERVYHAGSHAVQAAGKGIAFIIEFAAGVQLCKDDLYAGNMEFWVNAHRMPRPLSSTVTL